MAWQDDLNEEERAELREAELKKFEAARIYNELRAKLKSRAAARKRRAAAALQRSVKSSQD